MRVFADLEQFSEAAGTELGTSEWQTVSQEQVDGFADATGDRQWIHTDPQRAASGPFGGTIAHGYLTLSLAPVLAMQIYRVDRVASVVNYGADRVRFPAPVPVGSRIRETVSLIGVDHAGTGVRARLRFVIEVEGAAKPALVAEVIYVMVPDAPHRTSAESTSAGQEKS